MICRCIVFIFHVRCLEIGSFLKRLVPDRHKVPGLVADMKGRDWFLKSNGREFQFAVQVAEGGSTNKDCRTSRQGTQGLKDV